MNRRSRITFKSPCWHGGFDDVQRLVDLFTELHSEAVRALEAQAKASRERDDREHQERVEEALAEFKGDVSSSDVDVVRKVLKDPNLVYRRVSEDLELERMSPEMEVLYQEFNTRDTGAPDEVMSRFHAEQVREIKLKFGTTFGPKDNGLSIVLSRLGAEGDVAGDEMYVTGAASRIKGALRRRRPWYWWLRSYWVLLPFTGVTTLALVGGAVGALYPTNSADSSWWTPVAIAALITGQCLILRWLIPAFELIGNGRKSRANWAFGVIGALILSVVGTVLSSALKI